MKREVLCERESGIRGHSHAHLLTACGGGKQNKVFVGAGAEAEASWTYGCNELQFFSVSGKRDVSVDCGSQVFSLLNMGQSCI